MQGKRPAGEGPAQPANDRGGAGPEQGRGHDKGGAERPRTRAGPQVVGRGSVLERAGTWMWAGSPGGGARPGRGGAYTRAGLDLARRMKKQGSLRGGTRDGAGLRGRGRGAGPVRGAGPQRYPVGWVGLTAEQTPPPQLRSRVGAPEMSPMRPAYFRSRWRRPRESGAGDSVFSSGGDSRRGEVRRAPLWLPSSERREEIR